MSQPVSLEDAFVRLIAQEVGCRPPQVVSACELYAEGATVPFVARYRKEVTGGLDDEQLESIHKRRSYFLELAARRDAILESIAEQGKLSDSLAAAIRRATAKQDLEDLYLPYKPKRRTRAEIARQRGLEPLADLLLQKAAEKGCTTADLAQSFADTHQDVSDSEAALAGARDILAERLAEDAGHRAYLRRSLLAEGEMKVRVLPGKEEKGQVYKDYFDHSEAANRVKSHRLLAILRGEREGILISQLAIDDQAQVARLAAAWKVPLATPCGRQIDAATADGYKRLLRPSIGNEVRTRLREKAETEAIAVFRANLSALLLQSPLGLVPVMGLDPGLRTGCKLAVVEGTGRVVATEVIYPTTARAREAEAAQVLLRLIAQHKVRAVAVGNGTGGRETEAFARRVVSEAKLEGVVVAIVPETGASVYSASAVAREELPDLDVSLRGAVSIARRLQDPLAELVKIEPKSLGVGQYQHDVEQKALADELDSAVEGAVNGVGVELNTASAALLRRVSGLSDRLAKNIVQHRDSFGVFKGRDQLLAVPGFGPKTYLLSAGFLRVREGEHPLDRTAVHPERYPLVAAMAKDLGVEMGQLIGDPAMVASVDFKRYLDNEGGVGSFTLRDIRAELERPGRDPRPDFVVPSWRDDVQTVEDLETGMTLEGRVSNVTNFGAFVDIGVKRDGLVHLSELSTEWIDDPRKAVQVGQVVKVKVMQVDRERGRIGLSIKALQGEAGGASQQAARSKGKADRSPSRAEAKARPKRPAAPRQPATVEDLMRKFNRHG